VNAHPRSLAVGVVAVLALSSTPGCGAPAPDSPSVPRLWVMQAGFAVQIRSLDPELGRRLLGPSSVILGATAHREMDAFAWPSYDWFQSMVHGTGDYRGSGRPWLRPLRTVMYDPEAWADTPTPEQLDPGVYFRRFASLGHAQGWTVIITPHPNLTSVRGATCATQGDESTMDAYVRCGIAAKAARYADVVETQAQQLQGDPAAYRSFVVRTAEQARGANPRVRVIAGITTGRGFTPAQMFDAWSAVRDVVDGYYLSIAGNERLGVALRFLRMLPLGPGATAASVPAAT
jgi:hypothetical protein